MNRAMDPTQLLWFAVYMTLAATFIWGLFALFAPAWLSRTIGLLLGCIVLFLIIAAIAGRG